MSLHEDADMLFHTDLLKVGDSIVDVEGIDEGCDLPAEFNFSDFGHSEWMTGVTASAAASFESFHSGGDSGFSSPQDSPRDDWWATSAFVDASHDDVMAAHSRARLPSISLPHDLFAVTDTSALHMFDEDMHVAASVASEGSVVSLDHAIDNIHLFELDLHGPMVGNAAALSNKHVVAPIKLDHLIKLEGACELGSIDDALAVHHLLSQSSDILSEIASAPASPTACLTRTSSMASISVSGRSTPVGAHTVSPTPTAPSSPVLSSPHSVAAVSGIAPRLLTQYDEDPDGEIDVVGDGDDDMAELMYMPSNMSSVSAAATLAASTTHSAAAALSREPSVASTLRRVNSVASVATAPTMQPLVTRDASTVATPVTTTATPAAPSPGAPVSTLATGVSVTGAPTTIAPQALRMGATTAVPASAAGGSTQVSPAATSMHYMAGLPGLHHGSPHLTGAAGTAKSRAGPYPKRNSERKRHLHNELERKRREDLNLTFFRLGDLLPHLKNGSSQPTQVHILQGAALHIRELREKQVSLQATKSTLVSENQRLQERLRELQAMCIAAA